MYGVLGTRIVAIANMNVGSAQRHTMYQLRRIGLMGLEPRPSVGPGKNKIPERGSQKNSYKEMNQCGKGQVCIKGGWDSTRDPSVPHQRNGINAPIAVGRA